MILYHVSTDIEKNGRFYPRQPSATMENELYDMPRICVAPSIADCLSAIPRGGSRLDTLNLEQGGLYKVFRIDTEKLGIPDSAIIGWKELFQNAWVPDAEWTEEHWITEAFTVPEEDCFMIHLTNWEEESCDLIPHRIYELANAEYEGDYFQAYTDSEEKMVPCMSAIKDIQYEQESYKEGDSFDFFVEDEDVLERVLNLSKEVYGVELELEGMDEIIVAKGELKIADMAICAFGCMDTFHRILSEQASEGFVTTEAVL